MYDEDLIIALITACLIVPYCYILVSMAAKAWFDRKLEHHQSVLNNLEGDCTNGSEKR